VSRYDLTDFEWRVIAPLLFKFHFRRFVFVQQIVGKEIQTFFEFPPMRRGAGFELAAVKAEMEQRIKQAEKS
jgi:hypothetical protein